MIPRKHVVVNLNAIVKEAQTYERKNTVNDKHTVCIGCGHYRFLHHPFGGDCDACDSPEVTVDKKCKGFKEC